MKHRSLSQRMMRWLLPALVALILPATALGEALDIASLHPVVLPVQQDTGETGLYLGPTRRTSAPWAGLRLRHLTRPTVRRS